MSRALLAKGYRERGQERREPNIGLRFDVYRNNLKNRFLTASAFSQNSHPRSRLVHAQWSLAPNENFEKPPCQIPDSSDCFGIIIASLTSLCRFPNKRAVPKKKDVCDCLHPKQHRPPRIGQLLR